MFEQLVAASKKPILERWREFLLASYPAETARFLRDEKNRFANPVGWAAGHGLEAVLSEILGAGDEEKLRVHLDEVIRIRSVQDFTPGQAVSFAFLLKGAVRAELGAEIEKRGLHEEFFRFEERVDRLAVLAFETYTRCREELFALRLRSARGVLPACRGGRDPTAAPRSPAGSRDGRSDS